MAARRKTPQRRQPATATTSSTPAKATGAPVLPVQSQAVEAAAEALLADARSKADRIIESALTEASDRVRAANDDSDQVRAQAQAAADELSRNAADEAETLLAQAREQASRIRAEADGQAVEVQAQAELAAQRTEKAARERADLLHQQAVEDAAQLAADARERSDRIGAHAVAEASRITHEAKTEAERLLAEARTAADRSRAIIDKAEAEAAHIVEEAKGLRARSLASADREAKSIREAARAETEKQERRDDKLDTWSARAVIAGAVGLTASGEYELARMVGFDPRVAWLLPLVIDVYVVQAFRRHRDILQAISLTIAANVVYHLADKGLFGVEKVKAGHEPQWWLIALVASIASLILWRMHLITRPQEAAPAPKRDRQNTQTPAPVPPPVEPAVSAKTSDNNERQKPPTVAATTPPEPAAKKPAPGAKKPAQPRRQRGAKKPANKRRSLDEWVADAGPIFHAEFKRLRHNPTASEFAAAIQKAGLGKVSDSTAKNIRAEILDRAPLPELDGTE